MCKKTPESHRNPSTVLANLIQVEKKKPQRANSQMKEAKEDTSSWEALMEAQEHPIELGQTRTPGRCKPPSSPRHPNLTKIAAKKRILLEAITKWWEGWKCSPVQLRGPQRERRRREAARTAAPPLAQSALPVSAAPFPPHSMWSSPIWHPRSDYHQPLKMRC